MDIINSIVSNNVDAITKNILEKYENRFMQWINVLNIHSLDDINTAIRDITKSMYKDNIHNMGRYYTRHVFIGLLVKTSIDKHIITHDDLQHIIL